VLKTKRSYYPEAGKPIMQLVWLLVSESFPNLGYSCFQSSEETMLWGSLWAVVGCKSETLKIKMVTSIDCILGAHIFMVVLTVHITLCSRMTIDVC